MSVIHLGLLGLALTMAGAAAAQTPAVSPAEAAVRSADQAGVNAAANSGAFAIGTPVLDASGAPVGRITRLTTAKNGQTLVMVRKGVDTFSVPASALHMQNGSAVGDVSLDQMKALGAAASR